MATTGEQDAMDVIINMLKVAPSTSTPTTAIAKDMPAHCEQLAVMALTGKSKKAVGT